MNLSWLFEEPLFVTRYGAEIDKPRFLVTDAGRRWAVMLKAETQVIGGGESTAVLANGEYYDFGDNFPVVLGMMDEVAELAKSDLMANPAEHYLDREEYDEPTEDLGV